MMPFLNIQKQLEDKLASLNLDSETIFDEIQAGMYACKTTLEKLRTLVKSNGFKNLEAECYFFKCIKPQVVGKLIFFIKLATFEKSKPQCDKKALKKYLQKHLAELQSLFLVNQEFYTYQLQQRTDRDIEYFTRANGIINFHPNALFYCTDSDFSTSHDLLAAKIFAHQLLLDFYSKKRASLTGFKPIMSENSKLKWTGLKVDLVELVYALQASGLVNNGSAPIKDLAEGFETLFQIKLGDYYRTFLEIRTRKSKNSKLFKTLKTSLYKKIVEADG